MSEPWLVADNIIGINGSSKVFFLEEIEDSRYELLFGDGVLGKALENGARVEVSYLTTAGPESNGVRTFVFSGVLENPQGVSPNSFDVSITSTVASAGGEEIESTEKIRYTAPKAYGTQDRAVTADDYSAITVSYTHLRAHET